MPYDDIVLEAEEKMEKAVEVVATEFKGVRTGRATPALVEGVKVDYYGAPTPLKSLASITVPEPRLLMVKPFDPGALEGIIKAIQKADLGLNPQSDGKIVRCAVPPLSEEKNKDMTEDDKKRTKEEIDRLTKEYEAKVQDLVDKKTKEVMEV